VLAAFWLLGSALNLWQSSWYGKAMATVKQRPIGMMFVGSSRVAAAVCDTCAEEILSKASGRKVHVLNVGLGYTTIQEHYLLLRDLWQAAPEHVKGCVVMMEAPCGVPPIATWQDSWVDPSHPELVGTVMHGDDLSRFWRSGTDLRAKLLVGVPVLLGVADLFALRSGFRQGFFQGGEQLLRTVGEKIFPGQPRDKKGSGDLIERGGIRADQEGIRMVRRLVRQQMERQSRERLDVKSLGDLWRRDLVLASLMELVHSWGGSFVLLAAPGGPAMDAECREQKEARDVLIPQVTARGAYFLDVHFPTTDEDFPDLIHLRGSRSADYTRSLINAWLSESRKSHTNTLSCE